MGARRIFVAVLALLLASVHAQAGEVETARMTWPEIRDAVQAGSTTIIIPTGGTEQNGPHMVTGKHNVIVAETARRIAQRLGNALVAPVVPYTPEGDIGTREGHMAYPGTISVPPDVFENVLIAAGESFIAHGFKMVMFVGDSGPNQAPQRAAAADLSRRYHGVVAFNADRYYGENGQVALLTGQGETEAAIGAHAGIRDTSELMALAPDGVRAGLRVADKDGVSGDPARASAELGQKLIELKVEAALKDAAEARSRPASAADRPGFLARAWAWLFG